MSLRLEMMQVARLAPKLLGVEASQLVSTFLNSQRHPAGGFADRSGKSDLYYTVFALDSLIALQLDLDRPELRGYLATFSNGNGLDFVHRCCLARAWAALGERPEQTLAILEGVESFRTSDGGYHALPNQPFGSTYGAFLAVGAYQDLGRMVPEPLRLVQSLKFLETRDGAWANERSVPLGSTNATAAAVTVLRQLNQPINPAVGEWLLRRAHVQGGFCAAAGVPLPDLLSTATALHALAGLQTDFEALREPCLDFVDSLWTNAGSFHGHWQEDTLDSEYTFYGLLASGHLSV